MRKRTGESRRTEDARRNFGPTPHGREVDSGSLPDEPAPEDARPLPAARLARGAGGDLPALGGSRSRAPRGGLPAARGPRPLSRSRRGADPRRHELTREVTLNRLGCRRLFFWGDNEVAIALFRLAVELYPESANACDSLGEAHLLAGERELAILEYRRSLELNPDNDNAKAALRRLEER